MSHKKLYNQHHNELEKARYLLINRAQIFIREAEMYHLKMYKYRGGFFITLPCSKPEELREELLKDKIHILPIAKAIRIAISSISIREAKGLAKTIVDAKKRIDCI
jgi:aromatic-amino-acid transaminase